MPPLVEAGPAPMNIKVLMMRSVGSFIAPTSTVLKPAVRGDTPWNQPASNLSPTPSWPSVAELLHSNASTTTGPMISNAAVASNVILRWRLQGITLDRACPVRS
jgi:hypothetical protein